MKWPSPIIATMQPHRHLLLAAALIGLGLVPRTGNAQGASADLNLCAVSVPDRVTCIVADEPALENKQAASRCHVVECDASGERCTTPTALPNGWKQPLTAEQCRQVNQILNPLPSTEPPKTPEKGQSKAKDEPSKEGSCGAVYPNVPSCGSLPPEYAFRGQAAAIAAMKRVLGNQELQLHNESRTTKGACPGIGTHSNVRYGGRRVGSIMCCPCCVDTPPRPGGPAVIMRCRVAW